MINFRLEIASPCNWEYFRSFGCLHGCIFKNMAWELEHNYYSGMLLDAEFKLTSRRDHAGLEVMLGVLGYGIAFRIYDTRHWNHETSAWVNND